ncbi:MAG: hypothetical protein EBZ30_07005, partial [Flavobacteriia bacterium]|nr:hypothetical protein [Flavobacteriia bacterium]
MKKFLPLFAFWLLLACESPELTDAVALDSLVPLPLRMDVPVDGGTTAVQGSVRFVGISEADFAELEEWPQSADGMPILWKKEEGDAVSLQGYWLDIYPDSVVILAAGDAGVHAALSTLKQ